MVMVPTYNEAENIERLAHEVFRHAPEVEMLIVDDNSPDGTGRIADRLVAENPRVHVLHRKKMRGRGLAGIAGLRYALGWGAEAVVEMDADFSHDPKHLPQLIGGLSRADVVLGSRFVPGGADMGRGWLRHSITVLANRYIRLVLGIGIQDCTSGYRAFRREVLEAIDVDTLISRGPAIVQELLYSSLLSGFSVMEVPIVFVDRQRGVSSFNLRIMLEGFLMVPRLRWLAEAERWRELRIG
ncbi:MAG TPA: dolichyl-phosphate beta-D-mannosyltransferase [candidate division Zixibacteria bacterium]|nr:dolichyl-phosphate beta-D-mannosyltransferase [candidate division Zixibacteria bacterium]